MHTARVGFGCLVDDHGEVIYVVCGSSGKHKPNNKSEFYFTQNDLWHELQSLNDQIFKLSMHFYRQFPLLVW